MGVVQYGQKRNLILKFEEKVVMGEYNCLGKLKYEYANHQEISKDLPIHHFPISSERMEKISIRIKYLSLLKKLASERILLKEGYGLV